MKKYLKMKVIVPILIISSVILFYFTFWAPYNLYGVLTADTLGVSEMFNGIYTNRGINNIPQLSVYFKEHNISKIKYIGNHTYEVFTDKGDFIVIDCSDNEYFKYKIFKSDKEFEEYRNPM